MDDANLIEKYERKLTNLIAQMKADGIRYEAICFLLQEKAKNIDIIGYAENWLKEYGGKQPDV